MEANRVGERVASLRKLRGLTQRQLAEVTHFSTSLIKQVEQGTSPPSAARRLPPHRDRAVLATRSGDLDRADDYVIEARVTGSGGLRCRGIDASPLNMAVHWCALPVEAMNGAETLRRGSETRLTDTSRPKRMGHHHLDQARTWFLHGNRDRCLDELNAARRIAPFSTRHHPVVRETVLALATADRRTTESLAGFARWAGISL